MAYLDLVLNISLLVSMSIISGFIDDRWSRSSLAGQILQGLLFGAAAVFGMLRPLEVMPGVIFDGRSVMVSLGALFFGPVTGGIVVLLTIPLRIIIGGSGMVMGVLVIMSSIGIGVASRRILEPEKNPPSSLKLYVFGIAVHLTMIFLMFTLPWEVAVSMFIKIAPFILLLFPVATVLAGKILSDRLERTGHLSALNAARQDLAVTLQSIGEGVISTDIDGKVLLMNTAAEKMTGWSGGEARGHAIEEVFTCFKDEMDEQVDNPIEQVLNRQTEYELPENAVLVSRDGKKYPVADKATPVIDDQGTFKGAVLVFRDITEIQFNRRMIQIRLSLLEYAAVHTLEEFLQESIMTACSMIEGRFGCFLFYDSGKEDALLQQWSEGFEAEFMRTVFDQKAVKEKCVEQNNPWVYVPEINDQDIPDDISVLIAPVIHGQQVSAVLGVGKTGTELNTGDGQMLSLLSGVIWQICESKLFQGRMQSLAESVGAVLWEYDIPSDRWTYVAPQVSLIFGYEPREWTDLQFWLDRIHPDDRHWASSYCMDCTSRGEDHEFEYRFRKKDGGYIWVRDDVKVVMSAGKPEKIFGFMLDVTENKQVEISLKESEEKYRSLIEQSANMVLLHDYEGNFLEVNQAAVDILGYSRDELLSMNMFDLLEDRTRKEEITAQWASWESGRSYYFEDIHVSKEGKQILVSVNTRNLKIGNKPYILALAQDLTEQNKLKDQLLQSQKMESIGRLAGGVAHDFNNKLSVILGRLEIAAELLGPEDPVHEEIGEAVQAARQSVELTRQLLTFSRQQIIEPKILDINQSISSSLKMISRLIGEDIRLVWSPGEDIPSVKMDPIQLDQILTNICINARDAIEGVGTIELETRKVLIQKESSRMQLESVPGEYVVITISDDGCGMDDDTREKIFEPFFTKKADHKGTGLGLPMVFGIVKQNSGNIHVYSEAGRGTTIEIYLPCASGIPEQEVPCREDIPETGKGINVLIVEDSKPILDITESMVNQLGYTAVPAADPGKAIKIAQNLNSLDILLTDVVMPKMNGLELAEQLTLFFPDIKILFMSGYTANVIAHRGILDTGLNFIQKPFSKSELALKLEDILTEDQDKPDL